MWNSFNQLAANAKGLAEKAKAVAADLEGQLDKSVGIEGQQPGETTTASTSVEADDFGDEENAWNDDFGDDDLLDSSARADSVAPAVVADEDGGAAAAPVVATSIDPLLGDNQFPETTQTAQEETPTETESTREISDLSVPSVQPETEATPPLQEPVVDASTVQHDATKDVEDPSGSLFLDPPPQQQQQDPQLEGSSIPQPALAESLQPPSVEETDLNSASTQKDFVVVEQQETASSDHFFTTEAVSPEPSNDFSAPAAPLEASEPPVVAATEPKSAPPNDAVVSADSETVRKLQEQIALLQSQLHQREEQLVGKAEQVATMQAMFDSERQELEQRVEHTKEEAKRRLAKAKERVEMAEKRAAAASSSSSDTAAQKDEMITALREEGEKLAMKQAEMEKAVRMAKGEARELREQLEAEMEAKENALGKIAKLEGELKGTKAELAAARKGESQASKLEMDLQSAREETERKAATILALEQQVKELKASSKELVKELEAARKGAALDSEREQKKLKKEHTSMLEDLETKLRTTEKEAAVREDALRHEVAELRKRWQDAVRRADSLSMDVQSSTAPLMRQLESMERQNRTRAAGWATLETKLRQELEDAIVTTEQLQKERNELKTQHQRLERQHKDMETEFRTVQGSHDEQSNKIQSLETTLAEMESTHAVQKAEWDQVQRLANEGVARVRSEMTQTVVEAEERHVSQLDSLQNELRQERDKRQQLEQQVQGLLDKATAAAMLIPPMTNGDASSISPPLSPTQKPPPKKLASGQGQAEILAGALTGLGGDDDDDDDDSETLGRDPDIDDVDLNSDKADSSNYNNNEGGGDHSNHSGALAFSMEQRRGSSIAALEELQSRLKVAKVELATLRKSLTESEKTREALVTELAEARYAKEKLPQMEQQVQELTTENEQMTLEIRGLQEDISEVRELYRAQLNILLEEKATLNNGEQQQQEEEELAAAANAGEASSPLQQEEQQQEANPE